MRYKYETRGIILARAPSGEANAFITLITPELGLVRGRAQGVRRSGAKLASALTTFAESSFVLVRGKEDWRIVGAILDVNWFSQFETISARLTATRVSGLLLRLVVGEVHDPGLFSIIAGFFEALPKLPDALHKTAEVLAVLRVLAVLGFDTGEIPGKVSEFTPPILMKINTVRTDYVTRVNHGISVSGL